MSTESDWWEWPFPHGNPDAPIGARQKRLLAHLVAHSDRAFTMGELAKATNIHVPNVHYNARGLVSRGLAKVTTPVGPGSVRRIQVTAKGIASATNPQLA